VVLERGGSQLGRGESVADTARVLSRYADAIMIRTTQEEILLEMAEHASVPVINGLTDKTHPCQLMADVMTFEEHRGPIENKVVAWSGDGNNMAASWIQAAVRFRFELRLASPEQLSPPRDVLEWAASEGGKIVVTSNVEQAVKGADCVVTDTWVSMGDEAGDSPVRHNLLRAYRVDQRMMSLAKPDAIFMHCLPAHRGDEVTADVIDGPQSVVWDEAENRLHAQKGILYWCLT
jgi:ornithine carbamoyltransferase